MIFRSPYPDVAIPDLPLTQYVFRHAERLANKAALIDGPTGRTLTYGELAESVRRAAAGLAQQGFRKGDVFAIFAPNCLEYAIAFHAVATLGGITTPINPASTTDEVAHQLRETRATYLLTAPELLDRARVAADRSAVYKVLVVGDAGGATPFASLLDGVGAVPVVAIDPREDVVAILASSGTTGLPKGAMLTHTNFVAIAAAFAAAGEFTADDILPGQLPFFHIFGLCTTLTAGLSQGVTSVILPRFELGQLLQLVQDYGATRLYAVPPVLVALAKQPAVDHYDLSTVTTIICGAAPLGEEVARAVSRRLGCRVKQIYGLTEIAPTHLAPDDVHPSKLGSVGPCLPNTECKVVDLVTGADLGPDQTGELWTRGPQAMKGYLNQPAATSQAIDGDGWVHTGDIGFADADGYFYVVDRLKELIKYKAHQVAPAELEAVLLAHAAVADAAVIPSPDDEAGEVPKAFVVLNGEATPEELLAFVAARVAPYKKIRRLEFVEAIPKSPSGKILRRVLVERERGSRADQAVGDAGSPGVMMNGNAPMTEDQETPARAHP